MLHRQIQDCWIWQIDKDNKFDRRSAWIDLLLLANHREKKIALDGKPTVIERGQFHTSVKKLADRWGWDKRKVSRYLNNLECDGMIAQSRSSNGTTLTIINYGIYQSDSTADGTAHGTADGTAHGTADGTADGTQTINKKRKNENNVNNEKNIKDVFGPDEELEIAFNDFSQMRKKIKKPLTDRATNLILNKLNKLSGGNNQKAIDILNQSILKGWQDVYPLKVEIDETPKSDFMQKLQEAVERKEAQNVNP